MQSDLDSKLRKVRGRHEEQPEPVDFLSKRLLVLAQPAVIQPVAHISVRPTGHILTKLKSVYKWHGYF